MKGVEIYPGLIYDTSGFEGLFRGSVRQREDKNTLALTGLTYLNDNEDTLN